MKVRFGLRIKFFFLFFVFMVVLTGAIIYVTRNSYEDTIIDKYYEHAVSIAKLSASVLDGDKIEKYVVNGMETDGYQEDLARLNNIKEETNAYYVYVMYPYTKEEGIYIFDAVMTKEQIELVGSESAVLGDEVYFGEDFILTDVFYENREQYKSVLPESEYKKLENMKEDDNPYLLKLYFK